MACSRVTFTQPNDHNLPSTPHICSPFAGYIHSSSHRFYVIFLRYVTNGNVQHKGVSPCSPQSRSSSSRKAPSHSRKTSAVPIATFLGSTPQTSIQSTYFAGGLIANSNNSPYYDVKAFSLDDLKSRKRGNLLDNRSSLWTCSI